MCKSFGANPEIEPGFVSDRRGRLVCIDAIPAALRRYFGVYVFLLLVALMGILPGGTTNTQSLL